MKPTAYLLLIVLAFTVVAPMTSFTFIGRSDGGTFLGELDVCHSAAPALSANGEMPCVGMTSGIVLPSFSIAISAPVQPVFTELILSGSTEHPPQS